MYEKNEVVIFHYWFQMLKRYIGIEDLNQWGQK